MRRMDVMDLPSASAVVASATMASRVGVRTSRRRGKGSR